MLKKFPEFVFVAVRDPGENEWLNCEVESIEVIEENGPTKVATYKLVEVNELNKRVASKPKRNISTI